MNQPLTDEHMDNMSEPSRSLLHNDRVAPINDEIDTHYGFRLWRQHAAWRKSDLCDVADPAEHEDSSSSTSLHGCKKTFLIACAPGHRPHILDTSSNPRENILIVRTCSQPGGPLELPNHGSVCKPLRCVVNNNPTDPSQILTPRNLLLSFQNDPFSTNCDLVQKNDIERCDPDKYDVGEYGSNNNVLTDGDVVLGNEFCTPICHLPGLKLNPADREFKIGAPPVTKWGAATLPTSMASTFIGPWTVLQILIQSKNL